MAFKRPEEVIGNHIAKYQSVKLAKMLMAYDFERQLNPFVELGGFLFTFIGDGAPGTGKTTLIQMIAGLVDGYCQVAGYPFVYENFGVDQISSYQGKSGQNCRRFVDTVLNPRAIGFGTIDDIDQVAAKRSDDRASAGQQEITGVLMDAFGGASTVVRGNAPSACSPIIPRTSTMRCASGPARAGWSTVRRRARTISTSSCCSPATTIGSRSASTGSMLRRRSSAPSAKPMRRMRGRRKRG